MLKEIKLPDIGSYTNVPIIEVLVKPGDIVKKDSGLITLETEKATMEVPSPFGGIVKSVNVKVGDKISEGTLVVTLESEEGADKKPEVQAGEQKETKVSDKEINKTKAEAVSKPSETKSQLPPHASPGVRRFAREFGADLARLSGSGRKNRILKTDVQGYIKTELAKIQSGGGSGLGLNIAPWPEIDFTKFGEISKEPLSRIKKISGSYLHRNWVMVPHITQFDEADITALEQFRKDQQPLAEQQQVKLTLLPFIMKAVVTSLKAFPTFNASLSLDGAELILKHYYHIGVAVDTPNGLVVPVVRDVDQKGLFQLAKELGEISSRARAGQLSGAEMQGNSFSISSLGGVGGTAFTPIINVPDVAILGVSKAQIKPLYEAETGEFKPRLQLPLSLSYDHRVIDGAEGARFTTYLAKQLSDIRRLLL